MGNDVLQQNPWKMQEWKAPDLIKLSASLVFDSSHTKRCFGGFVGFFGGHVVNTSDLRGLDGSDGRVVEVAIVVTAIVVLDQRAISYVVPLLATLKARIFSLAVIHEWTLVVEFASRVSSFIGWGRGSWRCSGL